MKRLISLFVIGAALSVFPALADEGSRAAGSNPGTVAAKHPAMQEQGSSERDCCANHVRMIRSSDASSEQRDREGWGSAG